MSLLNARVWVDRVLVAVDTKVFVDDAFARDLGRPSGADSEMSKLVTVAHVGALLAFRGQFGFSTEAVRMCHLYPCSTFDELASEMPRILTAALGFLAAVLKAQGKPLEGEQEVVLAGWSEARKAMRATVYCLGGETGFEAFELEPGADWVTPWTEEQGEPPAIDDEAAMQRLAKEQARYFRSIDPNPPIGGRLVLAEVTEQGVRVGSVCRL